MKVVFAEEAVADVRAAIEYIAERNPAAALALAERLFELTRRLAAGDLEGPEQPLETGERVRSWPLPPYRIYYQRDGQKLSVIRIYHQARRPISR